MSRSMSRATSTMLVAGRIVPQRAPEPKARRSRFGSAFRALRCLDYRPAREHPCQMGAVLGAGMDVTLDVDAVGHGLNRRFEALFVQRLAHQGLLDSRRPI